MNNDFEIFDGKRYKDLLKDIVSNSEQKKEQINFAIMDLKDKINTVNDALLLAPIIRDYFDVGVKNDDELVKLASVIQRFVSVQPSADGSEHILTDEEKEELLKNIKEIDLSTKTPIPTKN
jgi:hypothetical protein